MASPSLVGTSFFGLDLSRLTARLSSLRRKVAQGQLLLEFDLGTLRYALGSVRDGVLDLSSVGRVDLPSEALERGVPTDPGQMAGLIRELCQEHKLYANQVSVVVPSEAALVRVVELPADLSIDQARDQLLDPALGLQLPIPLIQTDFDLVSCHLPLRRTGDQRLLRRYLLVAVPRELTGKVLQTMELADLNLQRLEVAQLAAMRLKQQQLRSLARAECDLWLELLPGRSICTVVADSGPVAQQTLVAIRDFPEPELDAEQSALSLSEGLHGEDITVRDSRYLPLSDLDLRVLVGEIKAFQESFAAGLPDCRWSRLWISGLNSAHPLLEELLLEQLELPVHRVDPLSDPQLGKVGFTRLLLSSGLSRLLGLAHGLLPQADDGVQGVEDLAWLVESDQLDVIDVEIEGESLEDSEASASDGDQIPAGELQLAPLQADGLDGTVEDSDAELVLVEDDSVGLPVNNESATDREAIVEPEVTDEPSDSLPDLVFSLSADRIDVNADPSPATNQEDLEQWPSIDGLQNVEGATSETEWPSIKTKELVEPLSSAELDPLSQKLEEEDAETDESVDQSLAPESSESSSLGELRFNDE